MSESDILLEEASADENEVVKAGNSGFASDATSKRHVAMLEEASADENEVKAGNSGKRPVRNRPDTVTIPIKDWNEMKQQNNRILRMLQEMDSEQPDSGMEEDRPTPRKRKREEAVESDVDFDSEVDKLIKPTESVAQGGNRDHIDQNLAELEQDYDREEETGPEVNEQFAKLVATMAKGRMTEEKKKEKFATLKRPKNCDIAVPKVNPEIWGIMNHDAKSVDLKLQRQQNTLTKAVYALMISGNVCVNSDNQETKQLLKSTADALGLMLKTIHDISLDRRAKILYAHHINKKYRKLGSPDIPVTKYLFGDDLKSACQTIDTSSKLGQNFSQSSQGRKFFPGQRSKNWSWQETWRRDGAYRSLRRPFNLRTRNHYQRGRGTGRGYHKTPTKAPQGA